MGRRAEPSESSGGTWVTGLMVILAVLIGGLLLSNQDGVNRRAAEVERVQRDLVSLAEESQLLSEQEKSRASTLFEQERLARERLHWTKPGEYIVRIKDD